jgi:hypothetical protein
MICPEWISAGMRTNDATFVKEGTGVEENEKEERYLKLVFL